MYTTLIHPLRKAYYLSINEYCVLEAVRGLANNTKYGGWCVMSIARIANALDLSESTINRAYSKLEEVSLLQKRKDSPQDTAVRSSDEWNEWFMADKADMLLALKTKNATITTIQPRSKPPDRGGVKLTEQTTQTSVNLTEGGGVKLTDNTYINNTYINNTNPEGSRFDKIYNLHPKKSDKNKARLHYSSLSKEEREEALRSLPECLKLWSTMELRYVPNVAKWLEQKQFKGLVPPKEKSFREKLLEDLAKQPTHE